MLKQHLTLFPITHVHEIANRLINRRKHIWKDAVRAMSRSTFAPRQSIDVTFVGEEAVDDGGPSRKFFHLALSEIANDSTLFQGPMHSRSFLHNGQALLERKYFYAGQLVAVSLGNEGPGLTCLSEAAYSYLCHGLPLKVTPKIDELSDSELIEKLQKVDKSMLEYELY